MGFLSSFKDRFTNDIGIDLGTANTLIYVRGKGIVLREPSVVAMDSSTKKIRAIGEEAKRMLGKTPGNIIAVRPMKEGVIANFEAVGKMIRYFISKIQDRRKFVSPRVVIGIPSEITEVERRAVEEAAQMAGAREIRLIPESLAAAIGAGLPIEEANGHMIIDIGGGTTEIAVISLGDIVVSKSIKIGGDKFDEAIMQHLKKFNNLIIGENTAEKIKKKVGNAMPMGKEEEIEIRGKDTTTGLSRMLRISSGEVREALQQPLNAIIDAIRSVFDETPSELVSDIGDKGIVLTGGGSLLKGLPQFISRATKVPVFRVENPMDCVVLGTGKYLESMRNGFKRL